jgi:hypothetical protein
MKVGYGWSKPSEDFFESSAPKSAASDSSVPKCAASKDVYDCPACRGRHVARSWKRGCEKYEKNLVPTAKVSLLDDELPASDLSASMIPITVQQVLQMSGTALEEWKEALRSELNKQLDKGLRVATAE